jgi:asparagine synthase (glutamine-hydrolysing)
VRREPTSQDVADYMDAMQRPTIDGLNTFVVCRAVRDAGFKVALSGQGGDEVTAGYRHFKLLPLLPAMHALGRMSGGRSARLAARLLSSPRLPPKTRALVGGQVTNAWELSLLQRQVWSTEDCWRAVGLPVDVVLEHPPASALMASAYGLSQAEYLLYLRSTLLPDADAFSMASSVELRVPLVDTDLLGVVLGAAPQRGLGKAGFAKALGDPWLRDLARAPKQGFSLPMDTWMRSGLLRSYVDALDDNGEAVWAYVDSAVGRPIVSAWRQGRRPWSHAWALASLNAWLRSITAS